MYQVQAIDYGPSEGEQSNDTASPLLEGRTLQVRAYLERITSRGTFVEKREGLHIIRAGLSGRTVEVQLTETDFKLLGLRGTIAAHLKEYLEKHLSPDSTYNY